MPASDDSLTLLFLCCHPALSEASQIALTLRAVGGLRTAQIAAAFLVPDATLAQRISRAKQTIRSSGVPFVMPAAGAHAERLRASPGPDLTTPQLSDEAIRLATMLHGLLPEDSEVTGLLALMLLTDARRPARTLPDGRLVPLDEQDRSRWDHGKIARGVALVSSALSSGPLGPYQLRLRVLMTGFLGDALADSAAGEPENLRRRLTGWLPPWVTRAAAW